jgi:hypothetical protein
MSSTVHVRNWPILSLLSSSLPARVRCAHARSHSRARPPSSYSESNARGAEPAVRRGRQHGSFIGPHSTRPSFCLWHALLALQPLPARPRRFGLGNERVLATIKHLVVHWCAFDERACTRARVGNVRHRCGPRAPMAPSVVLDDRICPPNRRGIFETLHQSHCVDHTTSGILLCLAAHRREPAVHNRAFWRVLANADRKPL